MDSAMREKRWVEREQALRDCLRKLPPEQRELIEQRYRDEASIEKISRQTDKTESAVYQLLYRIRKTLQDCVELTLNNANSKPT